MIDQRLGLYQYLSVKVSAPGRHSWRAPCAISAPEALAACLAEFAQGEQERDVLGHWP